MNMAVRARGLITMIPRFEPQKALEVIERDKATMFAGVPTMFAALLHHPAREQHDVQSIRLCVSGGAPIPVEILRGFDEAFDCKILEGYGLSETTGMGSFNLPDRERKPGSIGLPVGGTEMAIVDEDGNELPPGEPGEVVIRGHNIMKGYWKRPDATAEAMRDGWFHSGDIGRTDEDGYFYIVDRKKDLIIRGGYNVFPREVEEVLYEHPAVLEAAVVGAPDEEMGEEVCAAVVLRPQADASAEDLQQHVKSQLAAYKYPRRIWFLDELPKGPTGKILKREISPPG
jgi:long-chain acyl-CoA synthetase